MRFRQAKALCATGLMLVGCMGPWAKPSIAYVRSVVEDVTTLTDEETIQIALATVYGATSAGPSCRESVPPSLCADCSFNKCGVWNRPPAGMPAVIACATASIAVCQLFRLDTEEVEVINPTPTAEVSAAAR